MYLVNSVKFLQKKKVYNIPSSQREKECKREREKRSLHATYPQRSSRGDMTLKAKGSLKNHQRHPQPYLPSDFYAQLTSESWKDAWKRSNKPCNITSLKERKGKFLNFFCQGSKLQTENQFHHQVYNIKACLEASYLRIAKPLSFRSLPNSIMYTRMECATAKRDVSYVYPEVCNASLHHTYPITGTRQDWVTERQRSARNPCILSSRDSGKYLPAMYINERSQRKRSFALYNVRLAFAVSVRYVCLYTTAAYVDSRVYNLHHRRVKVALITYDAVKQLVCFVLYTLLYCGESN